MKKLICFLLMIILTVPSVGAEGLKAYKAREEMTVNRIEVDEEDQTAVAVIYTPENEIFSATRVFIKDKQAEFKLLYPDTAFTFKLYTDIGSDKVYSLACRDIEAIEDKKEETKDDIPEEKPEEFVPVYGNTAAATGAFAVVKNVCEKLDENNEAVASVTVLYRGAETEISFDTGYSLEDTLNGGKVSVLELEEGDVLKLEATLSGMLRGAKLIFEAPKTDAVADADEMSKLYTTVADKDKMSVFGIVGEKSDNSMTLYNAGGLEREALYLDLEPNTVVYRYDAKSRKDKVSIASVGEIVSSEINSADKDEYDNVTNWAQDRERVYAYVRVYDGIVCDVLLFENL